MGSAPHGPIHAVRATELASRNDAETVLRNTPFLLTSCSSDFRYRFVSEAYARMIERLPEDVIGKKIVEVMGETGFKTILPHVKAVLTGRRVEYEDQVHFKDVGPRLLHVIYMPDTDEFGNVQGWVASIIDITEKRYAERRIAADLRAMTLLREVGSECAREGATMDECLHQILNAAIIITGSQKANIQLCDQHTGVLRIAVQRGFKKPFLNFFKSVGTDDASAAAAALRSGKRVIIEDVLTNEVFVGKPSQKVLLKEDVRAVISTPLKSSKGRILGMLSTHFQQPNKPQDRELHLIDLLTRQAADYLERKQAEQAEKLLIQEVQHRSNNLLAVVQAIARHTFSGTNSFEQAKESFDGRLLALARCNRQITKSNDRIRLSDLLDLQLGPFANRATSRGPEVTISSQQAQDVSLLIHELVTNAAKHGALKTTSGKVEISWLVDSKSGRMLQLKWQERDGPAVVKQRQTGFGTMLLKATFPNAQVEYAPEGLSLHVEFPVGDDSSAVLFNSLL